MPPRLPFALSALALAAATVAVLAQPAPSAQVAQGEALFAEHCALCHGADGKRGAGFQTPIWGPGTQIAKFANAQGLFEYNQMLMPFNDPTTLNDEQKLAITAYMLANHGAMPRNETLTPANAAGIAVR
jgi:mono/diheme cytochrome c family protein